MRKWLAGAGALLAGLGSAVALAGFGTPGGELKVHPDNVNFQGDPDVAPLPGGGFVAAWSSLPTNSTNEIHVRRFGASDQPLADLVVFTSEAEADVPSIATRADGSGVVVWESTSSDDVVARRFDTSGAPVGGVIDVNGTDPGGYPDVAIAPDGTFVVAWSTTGSAYARRFAADGSPLSGNVALGPGDNDDIHVAVDSAGRVFAAWNDYSTDTEARIRGFSADLGTSMFDHKVVGPGDTVEPAILATADGFVVAYYEFDADDLLARRFGPDGAALGDPVDVDPGGSGGRRKPELAPLAGGRLALSFAEGAGGVARVLNADLSVNGERRSLHSAFAPVPLASDGATNVIGVHARSFDVFARRIVDDGSAAPTPTTTQTTSTPPPPPDPVPPAPPAPTLPAPAPPSAKPAAVQLASVATLPSTRRCVSRRNFRIRLRHPKGTKLKTATVRVNGKRVATRKGARVTAPVDLRGLPKGRFTVKIAAVLVDGRKVTGSRRYRTCAPKRK